MKWRYIAPYFLHLLYMLPTGVMRIFTDQLNAHIKKQADKMGIPVLWWPSAGGGVNGTKLRYVEKHYAGKCQGRGKFVYWIIADKEPVRTFVSRELKKNQADSFIVSIHAENRSNSVTSISIFRGLVAHATWKSRPISLSTMSFISVVSFFDTTMAIILSSWN